MGKRIAAAGAALAIAFGGTVAGVRGQSTEDVLRQNKEKKLAEPFLKKAAWTTDYDQAREQARQSGKPIFAYFCRSYAH